jgi:UDP-N-acetylmuramoyl-tripeptide--D-alanyl-D-alanine ligase
MLELGKLSKAEHIKLGKSIAAISPDFLITVGKEAVDIAKGALETGMQKSKVYTLTDETDISPAAEFLEKNLCNGVLLLIKGSRGVRLERFEDCIKAFVDEI